MRCGRNLVRTFLEYYHNTGDIPMQLHTEIVNKKHRSTKKQIRRRNKNRHQRPMTSRTQALMHFKNLNINYDSEFEDYNYSYRNASPMRAFEKLNEKFNKRLNKDVKTSTNDECRSQSPLPMTYIMPPEPNLSIIDFNVIARNDKSGKFQI